MATSTPQRQHDNNDTTNDGKTYIIGVGGILPNEEDQLEGWDVAVIVREGFEKVNPNARQLSKESTECQAIVRNCLVDGHNRVFICLEQWDKGHMILII